MHVSRTCAGRSLPARRWPSGGTLVLARTSGGGERYGGVPVNVLQICGMVSAALGRYCRFRLTMVGANGVRLGHARAGLVVELCRRSTEARPYRDRSD